MKKLSILMLALLTVGTSLSAVSFAQTVATETSTGNAPVEDVFGSDDVFGDADTTATTTDTATTTTTDNPFDTGSDDVFGDTDFTATADPSAGEPMPINNVETINELEGVIMSDGTSTTLSVEIPKAIVNEATSKAIVQLQYCLLEGVACVDVNTQELPLQDEVANAKLTTNLITNSNLDEVKLPNLKYLVKDASGEIVEVTNLPAGDDAVKFYETTVEFGQYDQIPSDLVVQTVASPALLEYISKAEMGTPFARVIITDNASGDQKIIPVVYKVPTEDDVVNAATVTDNTSKEEVKQAVTGLGDNLLMAAFALLILSGAGYFFVRKE